MSPQVPHVGIVLTDGESNKDEHLVQLEADNSRLHNQHLISVGIGNGVNFHELQVIADDPDYLNVLHVHRFDDLPGITDSLYNRICAFGTYKHALNTSGYS